MPKAPPAPHRVPAPPDAPPRGFFASARHYFTHRVDPLTSLFLVLPLYVVYQIGTLAEMQCGPAGCTWVRNGVDFITGNVMAATHGSRLAFAGITVGVGAALGVGILWARRRTRLHPKLFLPVLVESALYASLVGPAIVLAQHAVGLGAPGQNSFLGDVVSSCGAGLHEELIFRVVLFAGLAFVLRRTVMSRVPAVIVAALASSVVFSAVHHIGALGEPFAVGPFVFRILAGLIFAAVYATRGFAIAAWTHALYDVWVFAGERFFGH